MKKVQFLFLFSVIFFPAQGQSTLFCKTYGQFSVYNATNTLYKIDNITQEYGGCSTIPAVHVAVIDSGNCTPWGTYFTTLSFDTFNLNHQFGNYNNNGACRNRVEYYFVFRQNDSLQLNALNNMLTSSIPNGFSLLVYTYQYVNYDNWVSYAPTLLTTFQNLGMSAVGIVDSIPFIFYVQKGNLSSVQQVYGQNVNDSIQLTLNLPCVQTGIKNYSTDKFFCNIFPNPTTGLVNVISSGKDLNIEIVNFLGESIYSTKTIAEKAEVDLSKMANGLYFYKVFSDSKTMQTGKIILVK